MKLKMLTLIAALLAVFAQNSFGQLNAVPEVNPIQAWEDPKPVFGTIADAPESMPLSRLDLFEYMKTSSEYSWVSVSDDLILRNPDSNPWYSHRQTAGVRNRESLLELGSGELSFDVAETGYGSAPLWGDLETDDGYPNFIADGWISWYWNAEGRPETSSSLSFLMNEYVAIPAHGAIRARIVVWDDFGRLSTYNLYAQNDYFYPPSYYLQNPERGYQLILTFSDGDVAYNFRTGQRMETRGVKGFVQATLPESVSLTNWAALDITDEQVWANINPIVEATFDSGLGLNEVPLSAAIPVNRWLNRTGVEWATRVTVRLPDGFKFTAQIDPETHMFNYGFLDGETVLLEYHFDSGFGVKHTPPPVPPGKGG